jgi:hypothetical protein
MIGSSRVAKATVELLYPRVLLTGVSHSTRCGA